MLITNLGEIYDIAYNIIYSIKGLNIKSPIFYSINRDTTVKLSWFNSYFSFASNIILLKNILPKYFFH